MSLKSRGAPSPIHLAPQDRKLLQGAVHQHTNSPQTRDRARILLKADKGMSEQDIASVLGVNPLTVRDTCRRCREEGLREAVWRKRTSKYRVRLTAQQRNHLAQLLHHPDIRPRVLARARVLLCADHGMRHIDIAREAGVTPVTVVTVRQRFADGGLDAVLYDRPHPPPPKKYIVRLTPLQREQLQRHAKTVNGDQQARQRARLLLAVARGASDTEVAQRHNIDSSTVRELRRRFAQGGIDLALYRKPTVRSLVKLTDTHRRRIRALACTKVPAGYPEWNLRLLAREAMKRGIVPYISHESIRNILKRR